MQRALASASTLMTSLSTAALTTSPAVNAIDVFATDAPTIAADRVRDDVAALQTLRPSYPFWRHVFMVPDGAIAFGSALDGHLIATFPDSGDWSTAATWADPALAGSLGDEALPADLGERRDTVARRLAETAGPVLHNPTRGLFMLPNAERYGGLLNEWRSIYERFGVPGDLGLAQALVESGFSGTTRSEAGAVGFCQWMPANWRRLQHLSPYPIDATSQTTQAAYCAAYLSILATKYRSFIPALSEHHTGGVNVGRILINGERLGGQSIREQYFLGSDFAHDVRALAPGTYSDVYGTYGPRSFRYAEMIFGNAATVAQLASVIPQEQVFAMRGSRVRTAAEIARIAGVSVDEVGRFNPSLSRRSSAGSTIYLPRYVAALGPDVSFWHRRPNAVYTSALTELLTTDLSLEEWNASPFDAELELLRHRFIESRSEEGTIIATVLAYVLEERRESGHGAILQEFRTSERIQQLFDAARQARDASQSAADALPQTN